MNPLRELVFRSWTESGKFTFEWKKTKKKKKDKETLKKCCIKSLFSIDGKIVEQILSNNILE